jgi:1-deoxy-D-xylulose-5-phosphate synthase
MLALALCHEGPCAIRYPKANVSPLQHERVPIASGRSEILSWGRDGMILGYGAMVPACLEAARMLQHEGIEVGVVNARFLKPLDTQTVLRALRDYEFVITVEEAALMGGFGSAVLEAAADDGVDASHVRRLGIPDQFIEHGERGELLADLGLDASGIAAACRSMSQTTLDRARIPVK